MSTIYLAIDPGIRGCGVALGKSNSDRGELKAATYVRNPVTKGNDVAACMSMAAAVYDWVMPEAVKAGGACTPEVLIFEWPRAYQPAKQSGDQNDLLPLTAVNGAIAGLVTGRHLVGCSFRSDDTTHSSLENLEIVTVKPEAWKGQLKKGVMSARVLGRLSDEEQTRIVCRLASMRHNVLDACGLLLHHLGRLERRRVYG